MAVLAAVIATLRYLDNRPETDQQRDARLLKHHELIEHTKQFNKNN